MLRTGFPDAYFILEDILAEREKVVCRWTSQGTHRGEYLGIAPTGKRVMWTATAIYRIAGGKIAEVWGDMDRLGMLQQLGVMPK